jgi:hypothetical protein
MGLSFLAIADPLVIVHDLDIRRAFNRPKEAHPELVVDPDRVLPLSIARQGLKAITGRRPQIADFNRGVQVAKLPTRHLDQIGREALRALATEDRLGDLAAESCDHGAYVSINDTKIKSEYQVMIQNCAELCPPLRWLPFSIIDLVVAFTDIDGA